MTGTLICCFFDGSLFGGLVGHRGPDGAYLACADEADVLLQVNKVIAAYARLVTFSGRTFDLPILVHRSIINDVTPSTKLLNAARE